MILNPQPLINWLNRMGEPLYGHETPDGYPMTEAAWSGPGEMDDALRNRPPDRRWRAFQASYKLPATDASARTGAAAA